MSSTRVLLLLAVITVIFPSCRSGPAPDVCDTMQETVYLRMNWPAGLVCGDTAYISVVSEASGPERGEVEEGAGEVSGVLNGDYNLPTFTYKENEANPLITVTFVGTGLRYYGKRTRPEVTITRTDDLVGPQGARTVLIEDLDAVVLHEITEVIGFREKNDGGLYPALSDCAVEIPEAPIPLTHTLCPHEKQSLYKAFHLRDNLEVDLNRELISFVTIDPEEVTIEVGDIVSFRPVVVPTGPLPASGVSWSLADPDNILVVRRDVPSQFMVEGADEGRASLEATLVQTEAAEWPWPAVLEPADIAVVAESPPPADVDSVAVAPTDFDLDQSQPFVTMQATAFDAQGDTIPDIEFEWESSDRDVATVDPWPDESDRAIVSGCWLDGTRTATITATALGTTESASGIVTVTDVACRRD